jgi:hypothetical protein
VVPSIDVGISNWVEWLLAKDPRMRPRSAAAAWEQLEERMIANLGPRWHREAALVPLTNPGRAPGFQQTARRAFATPATRRLNDAFEHDQTASPKTLKGAPLAAAAPARGRFRAAAGVFKGLVAIALAASLVGAALHLPHQANGTGARPVDAASLAPTTSSPGPSSTAPTGSPVGVLHVPFASPQSGLNSSSLRDQVPVAQKLAASYRAAADRIASLPGQTESIRKLELALRTTAGAYRSAARAGARNDLPAFIRATKRIEIGKKLVRLEVAAIKGEGQPGQQDGAQQQPTSGGCAGDSQSDDPSDDSCGE